MVIDYADTNQTEPFTIAKIDNPQSCWFSCNVVVIVFLTLFHGTDSSAQRLKWFSRFFSSFIKFSLISSLVF